MRVIAIVAPWQTTQAVCDLGAAVCQGELPAAVVLEDGDSALPGFTRSWLGLDYDSVARRKPGIVYCPISAFCPVNRLRDAFGDPQVLHNRMIEQILHPRAGTISVTLPLDCVPHSRVTN